MIGIIEYIPIITKASMADWLMRLILNQLCVGSIPTGSTNNLRE